MIKIDSPLQINARGQLETLVGHSSDFRVFVTFECRVQWLLFDLIISWLKISSWFTMLLAALLHWNFPRNTLHFKIFGRVSLSPYLVDTLYQGTYFLTRLWLKIARFLWKERLLTIKKDLWFQTWENLQTCEPS